MPRPSRPAAATDLHEEAASPIGGDAEPEIRTRNAVARPIYKVRQYDTLRTIARDTLGRPAWVNEILDLNRDIIDDPAHLIVGQILQLPEDARPARAEVAIDRHGSNAGHSLVVAGVDARRATPPDPRLCAGGSLAVASSTPATPLWSPAKIRELNHA